MTQIYYTYIHKDNHSRLLKQSLPDLPKAYQEKIRSYRRWQDAQLSLLGRLLLKYGIKQINENIDPNKLRFNGTLKPYFESSTLEFNISHSGNLVVCAISDHCEIGIDVENIRPIEISDFKSQMTQKEWLSIMDSIDPTASFFQYWTQKEAVLKAHGSGMSTPLKSFENINCQTRVNDTNFFLREIKLDQEYTCHLAFNEKMDFELLGPFFVDSSDLN